MILAVALTIHLPFREAIDTESPGVWEMLEVYWTPDTLVSWDQLVMLAVQQVREQHR